VDVKLSFHFCEPETKVVFPKLWESEESRRHVVM
jgi:hypothetical protein